MRSFIPLLFILAACAASPADRYRSQLEPLGGKKKSDVDSVLGTPRFCREAADGQTCEYAINRRNQSSTDVLHVYFDGQGTVLGWEPIYLPL